MRGTAPNQQLQAGITIIMWEEMQLRELHVKALSFMQPAASLPCRWGCCEAEARELHLLSGRKVSGGVCSDH